MSSWNNNNNKKKVNIHQISQVMCSSIGEETDESIVPLVQNISKNNKFNYTIRNDKSTFKW